MTGMEHAIEKAAKMIDGILSADHQVAREMFGDEPDRIARALAEAGLLAPAPLQEEWAVQWPDGFVWDDYGTNRASAEDGITDEDVLLHRWTSDWTPADGVNRAEGDGSADQ